MGYSLACDNRVLITGHLSQDMFNTSLNQLLSFPSILVMVGQTQWRSVSKDVISCSEMYCNSNESIFLEMEIWSLIVYPDVFNTGIFTNLDIKKHHLC